ncbi:hypothetical protein Tco_1001851 [Tanacetum coccineum]
MGQYQTKGNKCSSMNDCSKIGNDNRSGNESRRSGNESTRSENECSYPRTESNDYGNDTDGDGANIRPSYDIEPTDKVPNNADYYVFVVEKQHTKQPKFINDTYLMENNDSNVTPDSSRYESL